MLNLSGDLIWSFHPQTFQIQWANFGSYSKFGMRSGQDCRSYLQMNSVSLENMIPEIEKSLSWEGVLNLKEKWNNNPISVYSKIVKVDDFSEPQMVCTAMDLKQKETLEKLFYQQARMASLGTLTSSLANEINSPLSLIMGKIEGLKIKAQNKNMSGQVFEEELTKILQTSQRIARITKSLRNLSRETDHDLMTTVFLSQIIDNALELCQERMNRYGIQLERKVDSNLLIDGKSAELSQVFMNIFSECIEALSPVVQGWIEIQTQKTDENLRILITDNRKYDPNKSSTSLPLNPYSTPNWSPLHLKNMGPGVAAMIIQESQGKLYLDPDSPHHRYIIELPNRDKTRKF